MAKITRFTEDGYDGIFYKGKKVWLIDKWVSNEKISEITSDFLEKINQEQLDKIKEIVADFDGFFFIIWKPGIDEKLELDITNLPEPFREIDYFSCCLDSNKVLWSKAGKDYWKKSKGVWK